MNPANPVASPRNVRSWPILPLFTALAVLAWAGWLGLRTVPRTPTASSPDVSFAQMMLLHHSQAVDLAIRLRDRLTALARPDGVQSALKVVTYDIATAQLIQIGTFQAWLELWGQPVVYRGRLDLSSMGMAAPEQVKSLSTLPLHEAETRFLELMIRHHRGGVAMAQQAEREATVPQVRALAGRIVSTQGAEIRQLETLLEARGQTPPAAPPMPNPPDMPGMNH